MSMIHFVFSTLILTSTGSEYCNVDNSVLSMPYNEFDNEAPGRWRYLAKQENCMATAIEVIEHYRAQQEQRLSMLYWHQAQIEASLGHYKDAVSLMQKAKMPVIDHDTGWNYYVDATISFLKGDKSALLKYRNILYSLPKPEGWPDSIRWPQNISVIDSLIKCFKKSYSIAYDKNCETK